MSRGWNEGSSALGEGSWRQLKSGRTWDDLVLPEDFLAHLRELPGVYREHLTSTGEGHPSLLLLFGGLRGMGKTTAALALAAELGLPTFEADVGEVLAQDPADATASITRLFKDVPDTAGVFVLDNADPMLRARRPGSRSQPAMTPLLRLGREENRLLGIVIVCAELIRPANQDPQLQFDRILVFPESTGSIRERIWRCHLPQDHQIPASDVVYLAQAFRLSGKAIANCCAGARRAAVGRSVTLTDISERLDAEYASRLTSDWTRAALSDLRDRAASASGAGDQPTRLEATPYTALATESAGRLPVADTHRGTIEDRWPLEPPAPGRRRLMAAIAVGGAIAAVSLGFVLSPHPKARPVATSRQVLSGPPSAVISYRSALARVLETLNQARMRYGRQLATARTPTAQAQASSALAAAHSNAASSLARFNTGPERSSNQALIAALQNAAGAYGALAQAARKRDERAYVGAQRQVSSAETSVASAVRQVRASAG